MKTEIQIISLLIISLTFSFHFVNAQVVYTDLIPDQGASCSGTNCSNSYDLDLNNDGTDDFKFTASSIPVNGKVSVNGLNGSKAMLLPLNFGDTIQSDFDWSGSEMLLRTVTYNWYDHHVYYGGPWLNGDHYLACKLVLTGNSYYGWIRLSVSTSYISNTTHSSFTIRDFAFDTIPGEMILAGEACPTEATITASGSTTFCAGNSVVLSVTTPSLAYQWQKDGMDVTGATEQIFSADQTGDYSCLTVYSCDEIVSNTISVTLNAKPKIKVISTPCSDDSVLLTCLANPNTGISYTWRKNGIKINGATDPNYWATEGGTYQCGVKIIATGCSGSSKQIPVSINCKLSVSANSSEGETISPNPFSAITSISFLAPKQERISLQIYDVQGRLIRTLANGQMTGGTHTLTWNARDENGNAVSEGIYFLRIQTERDAKTILISVIK